MGLDFGIVFRIDDLDADLFYIGETTDKRKWYDGYLGSGGSKWQRHKKKHPSIEKEPNNLDAHTYKRTILHKNIQTKHELYKLEVQEILKYCDYDEDKDRYFVSDPNCMNVKTTPQNEFSLEDIESCKECGVRGGLHKDHCSKSLGKCPECGYSLQSHRHDPSCSKYIKPKETKICKYCGITTGPHKKDCPKYKPPRPSSVCSECGGKHGKHYKTCSKTEKCRYCGYALQSSLHAKDCPLYKEPTKKCQECGGINNNHKLNCSKYIGNPICPECGSRNNAHKKTCSKFNLIICSECGGEGGHHYKTCSKNTRKICEFCGSSTRHKKDCPKHKQK